MELILNFNEGYRSVDSGRWKIKNVDCPDALITVQISTTPYSTILKIIGSRLCSGPDPITYSIIIHVRFPTSPPCLNVLLPLFIPTRVELLKDYKGGTKLGYYTEIH